MEMIKSFFRSLIKNMSLWVMAFMAEIISLILKEFNWRIFRPQKKVEKNLKLQIFWNMVGVEICTF